MKRTQPRMPPNAHRRLRIAAPIIVVVCSVAGCTQSRLVEPSPPMNTASPVASPSPSPSPSPSLTTSKSSPAEPKLKAAESAVVRFWRVIDRLSVDPTLKLEELTTVSRGTAAAQWRQNIREYRYERLEQTGRVVVINPKAKPSAKAGLYDVNACVDVGAVNLVDRKGRSVVAANRPAQIAYVYTVQQDGKSWFVTTEKAVGTC